jgi:ferritin-like protein
MSEYHEKWGALPEAIKDQHRALASLREELEAVDWYNQRVAVTEDEELRAILEHNRDEEIEHAAMVLEWLRRRVGGWDEELRTYLFTAKPITEVEEHGGARDPSLGIGSMKGND